MLSSNPPRWTPRDIARVLFRHRRKMVLFFCGVIALSLLVIALYPRSYSSESKLFIRVGRESVALDPTATTGQTMLLNKTQADEVNSALDILDSSAVQRRVVELVGADRILYEESTSSGASGESDDQVSLLSRLHDAKSSFRAWLKPILMNLRLSDPGTEADMAIRRVDSGLNVWAPKQSTIITLTYRAASPQLAHDVVDATIKAFLEQHLRLNHSEGSLEFFSNQAETLHAKLVSAQSELRDRKNEFQITSMAGKRAIFERQIEAVELQLLNVQRELAYAEARAANLTEAIANLEPEIITSRVDGFANEARDGMREKLYELELQESKLRSSYQDNHPLLMQVRRQREEAEQIVANLPDDRTQTTSSLNQNQRELELQRIVAQADAKALRAQQQSAKAQLGQLHEEMHALNDRELDIAELERNVGILEGKYRMHVEKLEQARVNDALGRKGMTNVKVAQPATVMTKPVAPNKRLLFALGLVVATGGALGLAFFAESIDQTFRTTEQVEKELGVRVLMSIPQGKRRWRRRKTRAASGASAAKLNGSANGEADHHLPGSYRLWVRAVGSTNGNGKPHAKTVGVMGCDSSKARSRVAARLAMQAANSETERVLLIDADARRRRVAKRFHVSGSPGWREVLRGAADVDSCIHRSRSGNLAVMAPGGTNGATATAEPTASPLGRLEEIKSDYGLVVVDLPPGRDWEGPPVTAEWLDEVVLVVEAERTRIQAALRVKETLERAGVPVTGAVLANRREYIPGWLYRRL